ncbi:MotA/TolQ/ExbB proton channel [Desulfatibacillum aliphaticivorans]|uniref:MotA/TolQ/ExbB proton channel n=1 Tax=Desulfatibacillum aliphaticivorans TaxID=218208 RepID=B8FC08_DESAL|nr:MotA/TolQ/ExbB proton channel family protein [Desulfatibacillum aliphaticivorans]ACL05213.1 MotA/TolQ/ExbB proton channel [Desulfatibacillum aliphaticivorans]
MMKQISKIEVLTSIVMGLLFLVGASWAGDVRTARVEAQIARERLAKEAQAEKAEALDEAKKIQAEIFADKARLKQAVAEMEVTSQGLAKETEAVEKHIAELDVQNKELAKEVAVAEADVKELLGFIRSNAKDLDALLLQSPQSALGLDPRIEGIRELSQGQGYPSMDDLSLMVELLVSEIVHSGQVRREQIPIVTREGITREAQVMTMGNFSAMASLDGDADFLLYSEPSQSFFQLSKPSPARMRAQLADYMAGKTQAVPVDVSRGAALRQFAHRLDYKEQIKSGGLIVWPILFIAVLACLLVIERLIFLLRVRTNVDVLMEKVVTLARQNKWDACMQACTQKGNRPVPLVLAAGLSCRGRCRADMENILGEAILRQIPRLERFLPTLGMLAAIAPLLGLLGTVTGMINTFHVITVAGTGDPRLMSGGISEALVTTMLGLAVAIPVTVAHVLLSRMVERNVGQMEEKSMALVNELCSEPACDVPVEKAA